ncbi:MAG: carbohydrate-binding family 9-like protein [Sedimentisphaerales bacterium]|nr:carbohydrate-binding family 9-like protein [Sedimentisphaerales bacterium]
MTIQRTNQQCIHRRKAWITRAAIQIAILVLVSGCAPLHTQAPEDNASPPSRPSQRTYTVQYLPQAEIKLDGHPDEPQWSLATIESDFIFPWQERTAPDTDFRALCDDDYFYFAFRVMDEDLFVLDDLPDEGYAVFEDRVEMYFARDDRMQSYYCIETDPHGRSMDYSGAYYRQLDLNWHCPGLETQGVLSGQGYTVEGRIPLTTFIDLGFPALRPGVKIRFGLFRAEFSHDRSGKPVEQKDSIHNLGRRIDGPPPIEAWMSWINPNVPSPDFHVPSALGWLQISE